MKTRTAVLLLFLVTQTVVGRDLLIQNGTVMTVTKGTIRNGSVLVRDGKIVQVGEGLSAGEGVEVIDATGKWVTPGLIDCHNHIGADSINEGSVSVSSMTGILDVFDPTDINIYRDLAGGVTVTNILHGSANPIGGKNLVIKHRYGKSASEMIFEGAKPGIKFALGENTVRPGKSGSPGGQRRYPSSRIGVDDVIRSAFRDAQKYQADWETYELRRGRGERAVPPRRDLTLEPLVEVLKGERLVHAHCYRADEILMLIRIAEDFGFKISTLQHVLEGYKVAKEIASHGAGASTFSDWWAYKVEAFDAIPHNAAIMVRKGVLVSLNSDGAEEARHLNQEAAKTMRYGGLSEDEALALITINPAKQLQIENRVGSLEVGKDADLVVFNQHPLSVYALPEMVFIDGELYFSPEKDRERQAQLESEKKRLAEAEKASPPEKKTSGRASSAAGTYEFELENVGTVRFELEQDGPMLTGRVISQALGTLTIYDGSVEGDTLSFKVDVDLGAGPQAVEVKGKVSEDGFNGSARTSGEEPVPLRGKRVPGWKSAFASRGGDR